MDRPPALNLIRFGNEWILTNGHVAADGSIHFPEDDSAEEVFSTNGTAPVSNQPGKTSAPPSDS